MKTKVCKRCNGTKLVSEFRKRKLPKKGYYTHCKSCETRLNKQRQNKNSQQDPDYYKKKYNNRKRRDPDYMKRRRIERYNITVEEYENLLISQNHRCAICGIHMIHLSKRLHIDHDHQTSKVRGLLCYKCNTGLGMFKDEYLLLKQAIKYLKLNS